MENHYFFVIVGSGAGGSAMARDLSFLGKSILIIEKGKNEKKVGTFLDSLRYYDANKLTKIPKKSKEGMIIWRTFMAGGSTMVSMGNGVRCLERELANFDIHLSTEFAYVENELSVKSIPDSLLSTASQRIRTAALSFGHQFVNMPKFVDFEKCKKCGHCSLGCIYEAKWTSHKHLVEACEHGTEVLYDTEVERVFIENGRAKGVVIKNKDEEQLIQAEVVILAAGGIGTPIILKKSGLTNAGNHLFVDILVNTYGQTKNFGMLNEPQMALVNLNMHAENGFLQATYINHPKEVRLIELGMSGFIMPDNRIIGIMTKIKDEASGEVFMDGSISKQVTEKDQEKIDLGTKISAQILIEAGAFPTSIKNSIPQGAHPGGTAAIGQIVNSNLETECKNLFICDASVLPEAPGLPPILTILALARRLAKGLIKDLT